MSPPKPRLPIAAWTAIGSDRRISLDQDGRATVLVLHGRENASISEEVQRAVRTLYPSPEEVLVASLIDLAWVPKLMVPVAHRALRKVYAEVSTRVPSGYAPEETVVMLPDWKGQVRRALGLEDVARSAAIAVVDEAGEVRGIRQGGELAGAAVTLLEQVFDAQDAT